MNPLPLGQPLLLRFELVGSALLGLALSAALFAGLVGYAVRKVSQETGERPQQLLLRLQADLAATVERARARWRSGAVGATWRHNRGSVLRVGGGLLAGESMLLLSVATSKGGLLGQGNVWFAGTVVVLASLLANLVMGLLWLAGPRPQGPRLYSHNGQQV